MIKLLIVYWQLFLKLPMIQLLLQQGVTPGSACPVMRYGETADLQLQECDTHGHGHAFISYQYTGQALCAMMVLVF